jgi:transposase
MQAAALSDDIDALRAIIVAQAAELQSRDALIEKLKAQLALLRRPRFGASSEKIDRAIEQLELALEEIETVSSETVVPAPVGAGEPERAKPSRQPLPDHLPRHEILHEIAACNCPTWLAAPTS